jgi:branched-chain amino acid transport system permease protein
MKKTNYFLQIVLPMIVVICLGIMIPRVIKATYFFYLAYIILQYVIMGSAWNILGGYTGYVNFGSAGFFGAGAYASAVCLLYLKTGLVVAVLAGGIVSGLLGFALGYLTIRVRGIYFSISTTALAVILQMIVLNSRFLGGGMGLRFVRPAPPLGFSSYMEFLFALMLFLAFAVVMVTRLIEKSWIGKSFRAIKDSEEAAESSGVATLRLKILATFLSCFFMGIAGGAFPYYITFLEPYSAMAFVISNYALAMPLVGGTGYWLGPVIGALLLGTMMQLITVTVSSDLNLLLLACTIIGFVILAPNGIIGLLKKEKKG